MVQVYSHTVIASVQGRAHSRNAALNKPQLKIGYISSDLRDHPLAHLMRGVFGHHDKETYDVHCISLTADKSAIRKEIQSAVSSFTDVEAMSDESIGDMVTTMEIDILIDLNGYTRGHRPRIFALRSSPIQALLGVGYPASSGRTGTYFVGDKVSSSPEQRSVFSEQIVQLPFCYQPNQYSNTKLISKGPVHDTLVLGMYNRSFKIDPNIFSVWMNVMKHIDSVIFEFLGTTSSAANLKQESAAAAVSPKRLRSVERAKIWRHLHRTAAADLFVDTHFYNAHTTGSDALWVGLPIITLNSMNFASRVSTSLLNAVDLTEASVASHKEYEDLVREFLIS